MKFGIELEFFLLEPDGVPALGTAADLASIASKTGLSAVPEFGSFQIELNPGPWPTTPSGRAAAMAHLKHEVDSLDRLAAGQGLTLSRAGLIPAISPEILEHPDFFTQKESYLASRRYYKGTSAQLELLDGSRFLFPGETVIGCINELHLHYQMEDDARTIQLFNRMNAMGMDLARKFLWAHRLNGTEIAPSQSTMDLFVQSDGEFDKSGTTNRVGFLPRTIDSYEDYWSIVETFPQIPSKNGFLPLETTVYFWVRLRGKPGSLRVEYRPAEMSEQWETTISDLLTVVNQLERAI